MTHQVYALAAGALGEVPARDGFLASLCEVAVAPAPAPGEEWARLAAADSGGAGSAGGQQVG